MSFVSKARLSSALLAVLAFLNPGIAQSPAGKAATDTPQAATTTPDELKEALVFESNHTKVTYQEDGSDVREVTAVIKVLSQAGVRGLAVLPFSYTSANETVEFDYVRVRKPDGTVVVTPDYNIQDMPADVTRGAPMYSDVHEKHVTVKALGVGDTLEYLVRYRTVKPQVPGQFWFAYTFAKDVVAKDQELMIDVPRDKYVKVVSPEIAPQTKDEGGRKVYTWKTENLERKEPGKVSALQKDESPKSSVQITTFHNWEEVGRWYGELARSQVIVTPKLQAKAAELTHGLSSDEDKIRAIYDFVSTRYHYVSLSFGIGRYQPHPAEDVFENEYGDCKDKHTLLAALLKAAGYEAWPALINATTRIDPDVPSPGQFNHVITVVPRGSGVLWLDTTPGVAPFGMLMADLRDKQALVMPAGKPAVLMTTPLNPPFPAEQTFTAKGKLTSEGTFTGHMQVTAFGDVGVIDRYIFQQYSSAQWKDLAQQISYRMGFSGEVSSVKASDLMEINKPFDYSYDYNREKMGDWDNHQLTAPLPLMGLEAAALEKEKPKEKVFLGAPGTVLYKAEVELPSGYNAAAPSKVDLKEDFAEFHASYDAKPGSFTVTRQLIIKRPNVQVSEWEKYQKFAKAISDDYGTWIVLNEPGGTADKQKTSSDVHADELFEEGLKSLREHDLSRSEDLYTQLIKIDPNYQYAHSNLGTVYLGEGRITDGIKELRKEEELHPDETYSYRTLGWALQNQHDTSGALEQFQKLLSLDPKDRDAAMSLSQVLEGEKRNPEAVRVLEKATSFAPDSIPLQTYLGFAYIRNGETGKGMLLLQKVVDAKVDSTRSAAELNNIAYTLMELNVGLDLSQEASERSSQMLQAASLKSTGNEALSNTSLLGATWDTVGWIYFKQGQYDKALPYLRASWMLTQNPEVGDHLGQLYAKLGKKQEAAHTYQLAYFAMNRNTPFAAGKTELDKIKQHYQELMGANAEIGANTAHRGANGSFSPMPVEELSRLREVKITSAAHPSAHGTFEVVLSPGKVEEVEQIDGDESLKTLSDKIKQAKYNVEFPDAGPVRIVRRGIVSCGGLECDLVLLQPDDRSLFSAQ